MRHVDERYTHGLKDNVDLLNKREAGLGLGHVARRDDGRGSRWNATGRTATVKLQQRDEDRVQAPGGGFVASQDREGY